MRTDVVVRSPPRQRIRAIRTFAVVSTREVLHHCAGAEVPRERPTGRVNLGGTAISSRAASEASVPCPERNDARLIGVRAGLVLAIASVLLPSPAMCTTTYTLQVLRTLRSDGAGSSTAKGINNGGVVVGGASSLSGTVVFRWRASTGMIGHGAVVPPNESQGLSINSAGMLCGYGITQPTGFAIGLNENPAGPLRSLPRLAGGGDAVANAISESGRSVGWSNRAVGCGAPECTSNPGAAVLWDSVGVLTPLPNLGGYFSAATDVSPDGSKICGYGANSSGQLLAFRVVSGVATALPPLTGYSESRAHGVNDAGQVVGYSRLGSTVRATLWNTTTPIDLGAPAGALSSIAQMINASGTIVGYSQWAGPTNRATRFDEGLSPTDLNGAQAESSPYTLLRCNDLNAVGQIVGDADSAGTVRGFLLTPLATTGVESGRSTPRLDLREPMPNPSHAGTSLRFALAEPGHVSLDVVDLGGRIVVRLSDSWLPAGEHLVQWKGEDARGNRVRPAMYFVRLTSAGRQAMRKLVVTH